MRIGIITLSASDNCGSLLQAYALKTCLEKYGDVEIINFSSAESHATYDIPQYSMLKRLVYGSKLKKLYRASNDYTFFRLKYLKMGKKEFFYRDLREISNNYDIVVTGSDQVWNVQMYDFSEAFFLGWTDSKKIAYAPSLGGRHLKLSVNYECIKRWLSSFTSLSSREEFGKACLEEVTGKKVTKVLDPTLILDELLWDQMIGEPLIEGEYIFYYSWAYCEKSTSKIVADTAKRLGLPVYVIDARKWIKRNPKKIGFILYERTGPEVFLNLMKYAKYCYVESFHGMIFAYIFKKNFWLLDTHEKESDLDTRLLELVNLFGVNKRILTKYNTSRIDQEKVMDYADNERLNILKKQSWEYLDMAFREA